MIESTTTITSKRDAWESLLLRIVQSLSLTNTQYDRLSSHYNAIGRLFDEPNNLELGDSIFFPQGSFSTRTIVKPISGEEVDVDAVLFLPKGTELNPTRLLEGLETELERARTQGHIEPKNRCVTIQYADQEVPCHMDVTPAIHARANPAKDGSGHLLVPDRETNHWKASAPKTFADWFEDRCKEDISITDSGIQRFTEARADVAPLPSQVMITSGEPLRVIIKLMKRHRDLYASKQKDGYKKPISVILTTLTGKAYSWVAAQSRIRALSPLEAFDMITDRIASGDSFDAPRENEQWRIENPVDCNENFAEKWNQDASYETGFFDWLSAFGHALRLGLEEFSEQAHYQTRLIEAFGPGAGVIAEEQITRLTAASYVPGLTSIAASTAWRESRAAKVLGLGESEPTRQEEPEPLDRLG